MNSKINSSGWGRARFLRGHMYFIQKITFKMIPWIDEDMDSDAANKVSNVELTNDQLWANIVADFQFAYDNLPEHHSQVGRANKYAAAAYLAKAYLYKAYRQDDQHNVTGIDQAELQKVVDLTDFVMGSPYRLENDFAYNFLPGIYENGSESIFAVQYSHEDGTKWGRLNYGNALTTPTSGGDFHKPSQNLVNAFKTVNGLPASNYNSDNYDEATDKVDPRLFHTVAIPGKPYKYTDQVFGTDQSRNPAVYGYYSSLKENVDPNDPGYKSIGPWFANSKNQIVLRYADVLLMRAEALIELGRHDDALPLINQIRSRAKASTNLIQFAGNVDIEVYEPGVNCTWDPSFAREALRWERRLELALEGSRFFDLVRWGIVEDIMNTFYREEAPRSEIYQNARFNKNRNEYVPVPEEQIRLSTDYTNRIRILISYDENKDNIYTGCMRCGAGCGAATTNDPYFDFFERCDNALLRGQRVKGDIDEKAGTVTVTLPADTDLTALRRS